MARSHWTTKATGTVSYCPVALGSGVVATTPQRVRIAVRLPAVMRRFSCCTIFLCDVRKKLCHLVRADDDDEDDDDAVTRG